MWTNTAAHEWHQGGGIGAAGTGASAEPNTGSTAGVGQYSSVANKVKGAIPETWEHEAKKEHPHTRPHLEKDQTNVGGLGNEGIAPGAGGMHTEAMGHHGSHFTGAPTGAGGTHIDSAAGHTAPSTGATTGAGVHTGAGHKESVKEKEEEPRT
ncbi:hypothetical protein WJX81_003634 [Elliptochloris bilobata]|uniref:Uncharacterized protein n=1 Tax=Elliptochloris bilobata TaxID=381761 RepID=A0AAW1RXE0_9CHLO